MPDSLQMLARVTLLSALALVCGLTALAQTQGENFRKLLREQAAFEAGDLAALDNGESVIKLLRVKDKRQIAVIGIVRLQNVHEISMPELRESLSQKSNRSVLGSGVFSTPPSVQDLGSLTIEDRDIEDIKKCVVGSCKLKLSAEMINRLRSEVDWNAPDHESQATQLFRRMLVEYLRDYLAGGDKALIQYDSEKNPVRLAEEHRILLDGSLFLRSLAPAFYNYLKKFPGGELSGVESTLEWSKVDFGLKPVISLTHILTYQQQSNENPLLLLATKQIYATHYFDASLALTFVVRVQAKDSVETYLIFTDASRSDSLDGILGGMKRTVVSKQATERVQDLLEQAKLDLERTANKQAVPVNGSEMESSTMSRIAKLFSNRVFQVILAMFFGALALHLYLRRKRRKQLQLSR